MNKTYYTLIRFIALFGNALYILWILYNAVDEGFRGTIYQVVSAVGLIFLLILNIILLNRKT